MRDETNSLQDCTVRITPNVPWRVEQVQSLERYRLSVVFKDGTQGEIDMQALIFGEHAGVFAVLRDPEIFNQVYLDYGAVTWPGEIDLAPDAMYHEIKQKGIWVLE